MPCGNMFHKCCIWNMAFLSAILSVYKIWYSSVSYIGNLHSTANYHWLQRQNLHILAALIVSCDSVIHYLYKCKSCCKCNWWVCFILPTQLKCQPLQCPFRPLGAWICDLWTTFGWLDNVLLTHVEGVVIPLTQLI